MNHRSLSTPGQILLSSLLLAMSILVPLPAMSADAIDTTSTDTTPVAAPATAPATTTTPATTEPAAAGTPAGTTLQGNVVEVSVTLNDLRDARLSITRVRKAAANLHDEVTRQQVTMNYNPNVIGTTVIMTPSPTFTGAFLPPRKKWVDASVAEIGPIIKLFKEDVDSAMESNRKTDVGDTTRTSLDPIRTNAFEAINDSFALYTKLVGLTAGAPYDNDAIASDVKSLDREMKELDVDLKKAINLLQKEAKSQKKAKVASN